MTVDLATATRETFAPHVGSHFTIALTDGELALELYEAQGLAAPAPDLRAPFALRFRSEVVTGYLPQRIYALAHPTLGTLEVFLVPLGPSPQGMRYEAMFG